MRVILDTRCWLWMLSTPERLSAKALSILDEPANEPLLSAVSSWEISIKYALGKLELPEPPATYVPDRMMRSGVVGLPIAHAHALAVALLPPHHNDPFDRLLIAQSMIEQLPILTADRQLSRYGIELIQA